MESGTDKMVRTGPLQARDLLLSAAVHGMLLTAVLMFVPQDGSDRPSPPQPVEVVFYSEPAPPIEDSELQKQVLSPGPVATVVQNLPSPLAIAPVRKPKPARKENRLEVSIDRVFQEVAPAPKPVPAPQTQPVRTAVFGEVKRQTATREERRTATGVFAEQPEPAQAPPVARDAATATRVGTFGSDREPGRLHPTNISGVSPINVRTGEFGAKPDAGSPVVRPGAGPTIRSGKTTRTVTNIAFASTREPDHSTASGRRSVRDGGFGDGTRTGGGAVKQMPVPPPDDPVEIVSKPAPGYTEEARRKRVEGVVLLEVLFQASGRLKVLRVLEGLGYGLDEEAVKATYNIKYKSARRNGRPVDSTATLRVVFQLV